MERSPHDSHQEIEDFPEGSDSDNELWLMSYSDMMTLLFGFFVLMYVFASQREDRTIDAQEEIAKQFGGKIHSRAVTLATEIKREIVGIPDLADIDIEETFDGVVLTFKTALLFDSGNAELRPEVRQSLQLMVERLKEKASKNSIVIEGHTDDRPVASHAFHDNWDLSAARAATVLRIFEAAGFAPAQLAAVGMGSSRPLAPNRDPAGTGISENRDRNRRVVIRIHVPRFPHPKVSVPPSGSA